MEHPPNGRMLIKSGIKVAYIVEESKDDVLEFRLAHRIKKVKYYMLSPAGIPYEVYFIKSRSDYLNFCFFKILIILLKYYIHEHNLLDLACSAKLVKSIMIVDTLFLDAYL